MLGVTLFGIFFTPVFYLVIRWFTGKGAAAAAPAGPAADGKAAGAVAAAVDHHVTTETGS
jgi:hypothetical protein